MPIGQLRVSLNGLVVWDQPQTALILVWAIMLVHLLVLVWVFVIAGVKNHQDQLALRLLELILVYH
jgi:hypothetical protein